MRTPPVIVLLVTATFVVILNETIMVNAIPRLMIDFDITARTAQWLSTIFMLTMAAVIPATGWFLQRVTTRTAYATAMATFCLGTLLAAVAPVFWMLLVGRVVQASGTAVMMPLLMTTLMTVVPEHDRGRVMGNVTLAMSCAPALGPAVSGVILSLGSWRLIFVFVLPVAAVVAYFGMRKLENVGETVASDLDWPSVGLAAAGFATLVYGLSEVGAGSRTSVIVEIGAGIVLVAIFVARQLRLQKSGTPLLDLRSFTHRNYTVSLAVMVAAMMTFLGALILLPLYLQNARGLSALQTGLLVMPGGLAMGILGPQIGKVYDRYGARILVIPSSLGIVAALAAFATVGAATPYALILALHVALMVCLSALFTPVFTLGLGALPPHLYSHGSSALGALQQVAGAIGTAVAVVILSTRQGALDSLSDTDALLSGIRWAFAASAIFGVVTAALTFLLPNRVANASAHGHGEAAPLHLEPVAD